jgi:hypothetical protein
MVTGGRFLQKCEVNMESLLTENEVSACLKVSLACLRRWRLQGDGPQYVKVNNMVRYREAALSQLAIYRTEVMPG